MKINKGLLFSIVVVMLASVFTYGAVYEAAGDGVVIEAYAAEPDPADTFDAVVHYDDNIQIEYLEMNKDGTFSDVTGDIQLGVLEDTNRNAIIRQLYCAAATILFHNAPDKDIIITHPPGNPYVDIASGYVIATPDIAEDSNARDFAQNMKQVMWLVANGYYGDNTGLSVNNASVKDLVARYPDIGLSASPNRARIAVIATKIAIWQFTDPMVAILRTSLNKDDQEIMYRLVKALKADANAYAAEDSPAPIGMQMDLFIDDNEAHYVTLPGVTAANNRYFYGPFTVENRNTEISSVNMDEIFLSVSGRNVGDINFVHDENGSPTTAALAKATEYGYPELPTTDSYRAPFVMDGEKFWLNIPDIDSYQNLSGITINAEARASDVAYTMATPQLVVYGDPAKTNGAQVWNEIQAFVGLMAAGSKGNIYGKAKIALHGGMPLTPGHVSVTKLLLDAYGNVINPVAGQTFVVNLLPTPYDGRIPRMFTLNQDNNWTTVAAVSNGAYEIEESPSPTQPYRLVAKSSDEVTISSAALEPNPQAAISVTNQRESSRLKIKKLVQDASGNAVSPVSSDRFIVNINDSTTGETVKSVLMQGGLFQGADGYTSEEITLTSGAYTVKEEVYDDDDNNRYTPLSFVYGDNSSPLPLSDGSVTIDVPTDGAVKELVITNQQFTGGVKVKKVTRINGTTVTPSPSAVFTVALTDENDAHNEFTVTLNRANGWEASVSDIPVGNYKVSETRGGEGWNVSYSPSRVSVADGSVTEVTVTNSKSDKPTGNTPKGNKPKESDKGKNKDKDKEKDTDENDEAADEGDDYTGGSADTGDGTPIGLWTTLLIVSGAGVIVAAIMNRRILATDRRRRRK
ncbi:MAG: thioester domain-containing protein [Clostridiales Family XIII bacterium]|jgi:hypothetical protein|nr:thioester domain-containing protein [Clostridiales Family XIII bacterium]